MTQDKQFKLEVRRYAAEHGLAYADARRRILEARAQQDAPCTTSSSSSRSSSDADRSPSCS